MNLRSVVVVGSVGLDAVETIHGRHRDALGGAAVYFSLAARYFAGPRMIGVVGSDFPEKHVRLLEKHGVDVDGLQRTPGRSFRWAGRYSADGNTAHTLDTQLGVFASFQPKLPKSYLTSRVLFLANIDPELQFHVLSQMRGRLSGGDTMNLWIQTRRRDLLRVLKKLDLLFVNDQEARLLTGEHNLIKASSALLKLGPSAALVKKGEHGSMICTASACLFCPPYPVTAVRDPTGAGDSFAGAFMGILAQAGGRKADIGLLARACAYGSVVSSFTVQEFGVKGLLKMRPSDIRVRLKELKSFVRIPSR